MPQKRHTVNQIVAKLRKADGEIVFHEHILNPARKTRHPRTQPDQAKCVSPGGAALGKVRFAAKTGYGKRKSFGISRRTPTSDEIKLPTHQDSPLRDTSSSLRFLLTSFCFYD